MESTKIKVLALDLEGTLISNAVSQIPRPGLFEFLTRCNQMFERIVMFTTVKVERFGPIAQFLAEERAVPGWFRNVECVDWNGKTKDLGFIQGVQPSEVLLVDDFEIYVHPGQEKQWVKIELFDYQNPAGDNGLAKVMAVLEKRLGKD